MNKTLLALAALPLLVATARSFAADVSPTAIEPAHQETHDLSWTAQVGGVGGQGFGGAAIGTTLLERQRWVSFGGTFEASGGFGTRLGLAAAAGASLRGDNGLGADLLGVVGMHRYDNVGSGLLSSDPGTGATLPFAGLRARCFYEFGQRARRFQLGFSGTIDRDLSQVTNTYSYEDRSWFGDGAGTKTVERKVGFTTIGAMLDLGASFDL